MYKIEIQFSHLNKLYLYIVFFFSLPAGVKYNLIFFPTFALMYIGGHTFVNSYCT